jgi:hypothetical protein
MRTILIPKGIMIDEKTRVAWDTLKKNSVNMSCLIRNFVQAQAAKYDK